MGSTVGQERQEPARHQFLKVMAGASSRLVHALAKLRMESFGGDSELANHVEVESGGVRPDHGTCHVGA